MWIIWAIGGPGQDALEFDQMNYHAKRGAMQLNLLGKIMDSSDQVQVCLIERIVLCTLHEMKRLQKVSPSN